MHRHIDELVANPPRHFAHPHEVLADDDLSIPDKRRILESWKLDAQRLAESTAENMSGGEETDLREVSKTLVELKAMEEVPEVQQRERRRARRANSPGVSKGMTTGAILGAAGALVGAAAGLFSFVAASGSWMLPVSVVLVGAVLGALGGGTVATIVRAAKA